MDEDQVRRAVLALQQHHATRPEGKRRLIEENPLISLIIGLKKIPNKAFKPHRILIPHTLYPPDETELCLFSRTDKKAAKDLLERKGVKTVHKVIPFDKLKTDYKTFESKKHLSSYYDVYLADRRVYHLLPRQLGKSFFVKKRFPFPVDLQKEDLSREIATARDSTYLYLGLGSCIAVPIGRINYPADHIVENVMQGMRGVSSKIPRGWRNIQAVHLKTIHSIALPLYTSLPPEPKLLAPSDGAPKRKRVKLEDTAPAGTIGDVSVSVSLPCVSEGEGEVRKGEEEERKGGGEGRKGGGEGRKGEGEVRTGEGEVRKGEGEGYGGSLAGTPATRTERKREVRSVPGKLSRKKVRGSTVISSRYEKLSRQRKHGRKSL